MRCSSEAVPSAICISKVDTSAELCGERCFADSALVVAYDFSDWMLCFVCCDLVHSDLDEGVCCVCAFGVVLVTMIACVKSGLVLAKHGLVCLEKKLIGFIGCSN